jgi:hypothetical protein
LLKLEQPSNDEALRCETNRADEALATGSTSARRKGLAATLGVGTASDFLDLEHLSIDQQQEVRAMVTTMNKRHRPMDSPASTGTGQTNANLGTVCLVKDCAELCAMPICRLHFASMVCGKTPSHTLRDGHGVVTFDKATNQAVYPDQIPADLLKRISRAKGQGKGSGGRGAGGRRDGATGGR